MMAVVFHLDIMVDYNNNIKDDEKIYIPILSMIQILRVMQTIMVATTKIKGIVTIKNKKIKTIHPSIWQLKYEK